MQGTQCHNLPLDGTGAAPIALRRVVVSLQLPTYQETIAEVVGRVRPALAVIAIDPDRVTADLLDQAPSLVICSAATAAIEQHAESWVVLHPEESTRAVVAGVLGLRTIQQVELGDILNVIDEFAATQPAS